MIESTKSLPNRTAEINECGFKMKKLVLSQLMSKSLSVVTRSYVEFGVKAKIAQAYNQIDKLESNHVENMQCVLIWFDSCIAWYTSPCKQRVYCNRRARCLRLSLIGPANFAKKQLINQR